MQGEQAIKANGCRGVPEVAHHLSYVSLRDICPVPVYHTLLLGLAKNLVRLAMSSYTARAQPVYVISHSSRKVMKQRAEEMAIPSEFGRPVRQITALCSLSCDLL